MGKKKSDVQKRNPVARSLTDKKYRNQIVKDKTVYSRKARSQKAEPSDFSALIFA